MHRFYVSKEDISENINNNQLVIKGEEFQHLSRVLRMSSGQSVTIFDGEGLEYKGNIISIGKVEALVSVGEPLFSLKESSLEVWLVQGIPKGEKMELIIQKATELGVKGIIPLKAKRCVVKLEGKKQLERQKRWQKVAIEAAKQCRRAVIPNILSACTLKEFLKGLPDKYNLLIPWEEGGASLKSLIKEQEKRKVNPIYIMIGPEGGFEQSEVEEVRNYGGIPLTLGQRILRTETASIATLSIVMFGWGDLG
ncbi:MAG: 16S rRNA (uracil(1498)-N(3))-methyltransferase [Clostridia bacterium]|nr:16S rRNA (uracil(1498)-N(3))-methyltransferase [Clostridia bacterium]MDD4048965.1 16S rRNA (uracil(1498)-N(3))-methyltransferase [Clostridia bacterium]